MSDTLNENYTKLNKKYQELKKSQNQIAIEELEKLKENIILLEKEIFNRYKDRNVISEWDSMKMNLYDNILEKINNQIKELKGE